MPEQDPLAQLRDIHLPAEISAWPPAPGWWVLALISIVLLALGINQIIKYIRRNRYRRLALKQLMLLNFDPSDPTLYLQQINQLLKRTALAANPHQDIAGLSGKKWLDFLDSCTRSTEFSRGAGSVLADGPYNSEKQQPFDQQSLLTLCQHWIKKHQVNKTLRSRSEPTC